MAKFESFSKKNVVSDKDKVLLIIKQHISRYSKVDDWYMVEELRKIWEEIDAEV